MLIINSKKWRTKHCDAQLSNSIIILRFSIPYLIFHSTNASIAS